MAYDLNPYTVKSGDTLGAISNARGFDYRDIAKYNNIANPNYIVPGQVIRFPGGTDTTTGTDTGPTVTPYISGVSDATQTALTDYEKGYTPSDTVNKAYSDLQTAKDSKPKYTDNYETAIKDIYDKIISDNTFTYDLNGDALYNQYKNQYTTLGTLAMQDTMGQAAALTGGYGSSYASTAGNQAYQSYLQQLNNVVPELYNQAYQRYQDNISNLYNQYGVASDMRSNEYNQYRDQMSDYNNSLSYAWDVYNTEKNFDYTRWADMFSYMFGKSEHENEDYWYNKNFNKT